MIRSASGAEKHSSSARARLTGNERASDADGDLDSFGRNPVQVRYSREGLRRLTSRLIITWTTRLMGSKLTLDTILARLDALEAAVLGRPRVRLSKAELAKAEGISTRTVDRRVEKGVLPPSDDVI